MNLIGRCLPQLCFQEVRRVGTTATRNEAGIEPNWLSLDRSVSHVIDGNSL